MNILSLKEQTRTYGVATVIVAGALMLSAVIALYPSLMSGYYVAQAQEYVSETLDGVYEPARAFALYQKALSYDARNEVALYNSARLAYVNGRYHEAIRRATVYQEMYPENDRILYVRGLAHAYVGALERAEEDLRLFVQGENATQFGRLDLGWVLFQQDKFTEAQQVLESAIAEYGSDVWLATSLGAVYVAEGNEHDARRMLIQARELADTITREEWFSAYSFNDPKHVDRDLASLKAVIATNLGILDGEIDESVTREAVLAPFAGVSSGGYARGISVSACGDSSVVSCTTSSCISAPNICGEVGTGTKSSCGGGCSASVPVDPTGTCTEPTVCGVNAIGFNGCNGFCNITEYPFCTTTQNPNGDGEIEWVVLDGSNGSGSGSGLGASDIVCEIFATPTLVRSGTPSVIRWLSTETVDATVESSSTNDMWQGRFGEQLSSGLSEETIFTLTCEGFDGSTHTDSVTVRVVPDWQEF